MNSPSGPDPKQPGQSESFDERIDMLLEELLFAFSQGRPSILLVFHDSESERARAELALEKRLAENGHALVPFLVDAEQYDIARLLSERPDRDRSVYSVSGLARGGGREGANAYRALNMRREYFVDYAIRVILWLAGDEAVQLSRHAPDFWAFRHRVVELNDPAEIHHQGVSINEAPADATAKRLERLFSLARQYRAKKALDLSIRHLQQGIAIARQANDTAWLATFWGELGLVYLDLDQPNRAVRACRKAIRFDPGNASLWNGLGHLYHVGKRFSDAIIAYRQGILLNPQNLPANISLVACYRRLGKAELAEKQRQLAQPILQNASEYEQAAFASACGNTGKALELLAIALEKKQAGVEDVRRDPNFDFIRADERFERIPGVDRSEKP